ncbi:AP-1-like transcription factor Yap3p [[Candida] anglica]|uniref:AP-1-like transcription factor Yap3p n=1 Tax=[Candida] anglica TaxID=148631 RepID=A0ABP0EH55_9ASCO
MSFDRPDMKYWNDDINMSGETTFTPGVESNFYGELNQQNMEQFNQVGDFHFNQNPYQNQEQPPIMQYGQQSQVSNFDINSNLNLNATSFHSPDTDKSSDLGLIAVDNSIGMDRATPESIEDVKTSKAKLKKQILDEQDAILIARDDSELTEVELQAKKKAQNRAAQRAFRERKESKLRELEAKLNKSEEEKQKLLDQLANANRQNNTIQSATDFLRRDESNNKYHGNLDGFTGSGANNDFDKFTFPKTQEDFINVLAKGHPVKRETLKKVYENEEYPDTKLLAIGAVWDYLQLKAEEFEIDDYSFDVEGIMNKLKGHERCHGFGPAYPLVLVDEAIKDCMR